MGETKEQEGKPMTEEDVVIITRSDGGYRDVRASFKKLKNSEEARTAYDAYKGSLFLEGGEAVDLIEQLAADFSRITHGLSAPRIHEIETQKREGLNKPAGD